MDLILISRVRQDFFVASGTLVRLAWYFRTSGMLAKLTTAQFLPPSP